MFIHNPCCSSWHYLEYLIVVVGRHNIKLAFWLHPGIFQVSVHQILVFLSLLLSIECNSLGIKTKRVNLTETILLRHPFQIVSDPLDPVSPLGAPALWRFHRTPRKCSRCLRSFLWVCFWTFLPIEAMASDLIWPDFESGTGPQQIRAKCCRALSI